jgi:hypothetical protein
VILSLAHTPFPELPDIKGSIADALNETANEAREVAIDATAAKFNISHFVLRKSVGITYARSYRLVAYLKFIGKRIALINFPVHQTSSGVTAQIERGRQKIYKHAFIRKSKTGKENVFIRVEAMEYTKDMLKEKKRRSGYLYNNSYGEFHDKHGYPITTIKGISIPDMLQNKDVKARVIESIARLLPQSMDKFTRI